ncbi:MAG: ATP-binding protein [Clostridia bacterium]|nr:ATP-binding protein [Clostridia bacterium]
MKLSAVDDNLEKTLDFIRECLKGSGCTEKFVRQVELYVEEIFVNIAHYAYAPDTGDVEISAEVLNDKIRVVFTDEGKRYNPLEKSDPDISLSADEREIGGLGIFMTKKLTDKIEYEYKDGKNILITEKNFG